ncbi:MAG: AzlC family ABC transporter permease [Rhodobacteraceae bacterium]|nr:AzlC family ABC transporter permease [Paracoccaceae bacterium]
MLFGVVATEAGLDLAQTMGMTVAVIAGAAQFAAVALMVEDAPVLIVGHRACGELPDGD